MSPEDYNLPDSLPLHIPQSICWELESAVRIFLAHQLPIGFIWIFGSYARGDFINDHNINEDGIPTSYESDIDLLIILEKGPKQLDRTRNQLEKRFEARGAHATHIHTFYVTIESLNAHLRKGQFLLLAEALREKERLQALLDQKER